MAEGKDPYRLQLSIVGAVDRHGRQYYRARSALVTKEKPICCHSWQFKIHSDAWNARFGWFRWSQTDDRVTNRQTDKTDHFTTCACALGNKTVTSDMFCFSKDNSTARKTNLVTDRIHSSQYTQGLEKKKLQPHELARKVYHEITTSTDWLQFPGLIGYWTLWPYAERVVNKARKRGPAKTRTARLLKSCFIPSSQVTSGQHRLHLWTTAPW